MEPKQSGKNRREKQETGKRAKKKTGLSGLVQGHGISPNVNVNLLTQMCKPDLRGTMSYLEGMQADDEPEMEVLETPEREQKCKGSEQTKRGRGRKKGL